MLSSGPMVMSRMLSLKNHALETADLYCVMGWYIALCMVKKWHLWYPLTMTYVLSCWYCIMTVLGLATWGCITYREHWVNGTIGKGCIMIAMHIIEGVMLAKPPKCPCRSHRGCCNCWHHLITCLRNAWWISLLTCLSPNGDMMLLKCLWIVCLSTYILCLVRVRFPLKSLHSCSLQWWCHGMVCLSGSYLIAMAGTLVGFGSLWWVRLGVT